jgi:hypothetical protein
MSKIHNKTKNNCICCECKISNGVFLHKTRRQSHYLCIDCAENYLNPYIQKMTNNLRKNIKIRNFNIKCPGTYCGNYRNQCKKDISIKDLIISDKNTNLYINLFRLNYVVENKNAFLCINEKCGEVIITEDQYMIDIECPSCKKSWCKNCMTEPFHTNISCFENELNKTDTKNSEYIKKLKNQGILKFCPQCNSPTVKLKNEEGEDIGCNKIICVECGAKWCWLCNHFPIDYDHYNENNNNNCSNRLWEGVVV